MPEPIPTVRVIPIAECPVMDICPDKSPEHCFTCAYTHGWDDGWQAGFTEGYDHGMEEREGDQEPADANERYE